jgi:hypothetical protein
MPTLDFIAIGPGRRTGAYYAGYIRHGTRTFVPLVDCVTAESAQEAAAQLTRDAIERDRLVAIQTQRFIACNVVRGFYDDEVQV